MVKMLSVILPFLLLVSLCSAQYSPSPDWETSCGADFQDLGVYVNFSSAVAHVVHSITVEDIHHFFGVQLGEENGIPSANTDLNARDEDIIIANAPSRPGDPGVQSPGFHTFIETMEHIDDPNFGMKENVLARLAHNFHMHEMWTKVRAQADTFATSPVSKQICDCARDAEGSGLIKYLTAIFIYFRDVFNQHPGGRPNGRTRAQISFSSFSYRGYRRWVDIKSIGRRAWGRRGNPNLPVLNDLATWRVWHDMLQESMLSPEEVRAAGLYMHCATRKNN